MTLYMKRILFVVTTLGNGGAERVMLYIMNYLTKYTDLQVSLLLLKDEKNYYLEELSDKVIVYRLSLKSKHIKYHCLKILNRIRNIAPDVCFVGLSGLNILLAPFLRIVTPQIKFVVRETLVLSYRYSNAKYMTFLYKLFYNNYERIIAQSTDMYNDLIINWGVNEDKCIKINNPIDVSEVLRKRNINSNITLSSRSRKKFVAVGRLNYQKGFDILIQRLSENKDLDFSLFIFGEGALRNELQELIERSGLSEKVKLMGFSADVITYMGLSDGLILSSRYEGFPNVLLEANALGKPVFANNCPGGINEIIIDGVNGYAINMEDSGKFKQYFTKFMLDEFDSERIRQCTKERYGAQKILKQYVDVLLSIIYK